MKTPGQVIDKKLRRLYLRRAWQDVTVKALLFAALMIVLFTYFYRLMIVPDEGMAPSLRQGDLTLFDTFSYTPQYTDVVCYKSEDGARVGRVMALPGEVVDINAEGQYLVNGAPQAQDGKPIILTERGGISYPVEIGPDSVFILNDNHDDVGDSRNAGPVPLQDISGRLLMLMRRRSF